MISERILSEDDERVSVYNFRPQANEGNHRSKCRTGSTYFVVWNSGKSILKEDSFAAFTDLKTKKHLYVKEVFNRGKHVYIKSVEEAFLSGVKIKSCYLCRYHAKKEFCEYLDDNSPIFCKHLRKRCRSNVAAQCQCYMPDKKVLEYATDM